MKLNTVLALTIAVVIVVLCNCETYRPLQWSPLNPSFNVTSGGKKSAYRINVSMHSRFNIICPNPANNPVTIEKAIQKENMYENIWSVNKKSFDTCVVNTTNVMNNLFFKCNDPLNLKYHPMIILPTTNVRSHPEFEAGKDHYFIATSNGSQNSLDSSAMGHCHTANMRFIIYVCKDKNDPLCVAKGPNTNEKIVDNQTFTQPPTNGRENDVAASSRGADCFIAVEEIIWLVLVCVLGLLVLLLLISHMCLCFTRRKKLQTAHSEEKRAKLI